MNRPKRSWPAGWLFLGIVGLAYGLCFLFDPLGVGEALAVAGGLLQQMAPVLVLVFLLMFLSHLLVTPGWVRRHLGRESGLRGWAMAILGGILSVGPVYVWYGLLKEMRGHGMRMALISGFLYNRGIKLHLLPLLALYFGWAYATALVLYMVLLSIPAALLLEWALRGREG